MGDDLHEDMNVEPDEELGDVAGAQVKIKKLREELKEAQHKRDEYLDGWQRCKADAINGRKEVLDEADRRAMRIKEAILDDLIPALDSFDMAIGSDGWNDVSDGWRSGIQHVHNQLLDALSRNGIERFGKIGDSFDPRLHEVVQEVDDVPGEPHSIVKILRFGYRAADMTLRPAQVIAKAAQNT